jgi:hypothetical protein
MPLFRYFGWAGSFLLAALFAANWCCSAPIARAPRSDVPLDQKIIIRIHTDHEWPERVVFHTARSTLTDESKANAETDIGGGEIPAVAQRQPFDAFAEMAVIHVRPCYRPPCSERQPAKRDALPVWKDQPNRNRSPLSTAQCKRLTCPSPPHKPQGRS